MWSMWKFYNQARPSFLNETEFFFNNQRLNFDWDNIQINK